MSGAKREYWDIQKGYAMSWYAVLKDGIKLLCKYKERQQEDLVVDEMQWSDRNEECLRLKEQGYTLSWRKKSEMREALEEGREYFTVTEHKRWFRRVRFDDREAGPIYLVMKKPNGA